MSFNYAGMKATADRLIAKFGQAATLRRPNVTGPSHNPVVAAPTDYPVTLVVEDYRLDQIDGVRVLQTDRKVLLAKGSLTVEPTASDQLVIGGAVYAIVMIRPTNPGGISVLYEIQARR